MVFFAQKSRGFTFVEVMVTVIIITSGAMFLMPGLAVSSRISRVAEGQAKAYLFAVSKLSDLELNASEMPTVETFAQEDSGFFDRYSRDSKWLVQTSPLLEDPLLQKVQCDFIWPGRGEGEHYRLLTAFRFDALE